MYKSLLVLLSLSACSETLTPEERGIEVTDKIGIFNQSKAMFMAQTLVEDKFHVDLGDLSTHGTTVYWTDTKCPKNGQFAVVYNGECNYGRMWSCDEMYVALSNLDPEHTCGSALLHEFGHCMSMEMGLGGDSGHTNDRLWDTIGYANEISCERLW